MIELRQDWTREILNVRQEMERFFGDFATRKPPSVRFSPRTWEPAVDVYETTEEIVVLVELAGMEQEEIEVEVSAKTLLVRGHRKDVKQGIRRSYYQMEVLWGPFERSIVLPMAVDASQTKAFYESGLLEIVLPRLPEGQTRQVRIKAG